MVRKNWKKRSIRSIRRSEILRRNAFTKKTINSKKSETNFTGKLIKYGGIFQATMGLFLEYFSQSTIHGFNHIGDKKRSILERIIWLFAVVLSIIACCYLMTNFWNKRYSNPVIVTYNENQLPVWEIPFPSVTICPEIKTHTDIFNFTEIYEKTKKNEILQEKEKYYWEAISQTCDLNFSSLYGNFIANAANLISALSDAAPTLNETLIQCIFRNENLKCYERLDQILTNDGICFNFNALKPKEYIKNEYLEIINNNDNTTSEWNREKGYNIEANNVTFPARVIGSGNREKLLIILANKILDSDRFCRSSSQGYKVFFNTPGEMPHTSDRYLSVSLQQKASIVIIPEIVISEKGLRQYEPNRRKCYYQDERFLRYFKFYNQANCQLECLSNHTLEKCGCVKFSMPRNSSHAVCGTRSMTCLHNVEIMLLEMKFEQRSQKTRLNDPKNCNCLPSCIDVQYKSVLEYQDEFDYTAMYRYYYKKDLLKEYPGNQFSNIKIYFKEEAFNALKRSELYSTTDFISNCGGLLSLFMGVSILNLVELVYFFTIRFLMSLKMKWRKRQQILKNNQTGTKLFTRHFIEPQCGHGQPQRYLE